MVKVNEEAHILSDGSIDLEAWLAHLEQNHHYADMRLIRNACVLAELAGVDHATESGESCLQQGLAMAEILSDLELDQDAIAAAIIYDSTQYADLNVEDVEEQLGPKVAKLVSGVERMSAIHNMRGFTNGHLSTQQNDNVRKMLLSMVDDVRVVLIKLAERLRIMRTVAPLSQSVRVPLAEECMQMYAPLANRLGLGQIKWELEDLSFRFLQPEKYKEIAKGLKTRRVDRDKYVKKIEGLLLDMVQQEHIANYAVYGRSKHIQSIYKKMQRKNLDLREVYDATAFRILVDTVEDCYKVLSLVHTLWQQIPAEFDDYIANPKPNGYQSLHTAVIGPDDRVFEVQIRTHQMHEFAEMGVAAHWKYKEGSSTKQESHERKIAWLRDVLAWQHELAEEHEPIDDLDNTFLDDRVYIFTPRGDVLDLPLGSTPLDFAYHVHSEVGHRCRGAKVDGKIVTLTHELQTGEQVEVLTGKHAKPSRDWLNPHLNYLKSSRAKAKIHHWFKLQNFDKNREEGSEILNIELKKLALKEPNLNDLAHQLNFKRADDLLASLGRGDIKCGQILAKIPQKLHSEEVLPKRITSKLRAPAQKTKPQGDILIDGVGNLLTKMAKCCNPLPGDAIIGYITLGRGISIHKQDCSNILHAPETKRDRLITVSWGAEKQNIYPVDVNVHAYDRHGLLKDVIAILSTEKTNVINLDTKINKSENVADINLTIEVNDIHLLSKVLDKIKQLPNVIEARRI